MSQSSTPFKAFVVLSSTAWLVSFGLGLDDVLSGTHQVPVLMTESAEPAGHPTVFAVKEGLGASEAGLVAGDVIVRVGESDLAGLDRHELRAAFSDRQGRGLTVPIVFERDGHRYEAEWQGHTRASYWPRLLASLAYLASEDPVPTSRVRRVMPVGRDGNQMEWPACNEAVRSSRNSPRM